MDELRDYRFYSEDMLHPNQVAIDYIWEQFKTVWISSESFQILDRIDSIQKGLNHNPFNPDSEQHKTFLKNLENQKNLVTKEFPYITF